jgi:glycosyltransferase involved in cell wall biosynthesis
MKSSLKLGLVTGEYPPLEGGVGAFSQALAQALAGAGHEIHIITDRRARPPTASRRLSELGEPIDIGFAQLHARIQGWRWPSLATIADITLRYELDLVNIQYQAAAYNMRSPAINCLPWRLKGLSKTVVTCHDLRVPYLFPKAGRLRPAAVRFMARQAHGVIVTNAEDENTLRSTVSTPLRQIAIGSNITSYRPNHVEVAEAREKLGVTPAHCLLGYFGFLHQSKGADTLLRALAQLDERVHLVFIGGPTGTSDKANNQAFLDQLKQLTGELGLAQRVHWSGFMAEKRVSAYLHAADLMVMPYRDGVSLRRGTLMAVLAHGRPLITTAPTGPTPELRHGHNVWFVPVDDAAALAQAMQRLTADPELRARLGKGAAEVADMFTWDKIAAQTIEFFMAIVKGVARPGLKPPG